MLLLWLMTAQVGCLALVLVVLILAPGPMYTSDGFADLLRRVVRPELDRRLSERVRPVEDSLQARIDRLFLEHEGDASASPGALLRELARDPSSEQRVDRGMNRLSRVRRQIHSRAEAELHGAASERSLDAYIRSVSRTKNGATRRLLLVGVVQSALLIAPRVALTSGTPRRVTFWARWLSLPLWVAIAFALGLPWVVVSVATLLATTIVALAWVLRIEVERIGRAHDDPKAAKLMWRVIVGNAVLAGPAVVIAVRWQPHAMLLEQIAPREDASFGVIARIGFAIVAVGLAMFATGLRPARNGLHELSTDLRTWAADSALAGIVTAVAVVGFFMALTGAGPEGGIAVAVMMGLIAGGLVVGVLLYVGAIVRAEYEEHRRRRLCAQAGIHFTWYPGRAILVSGCVVTFVVTMSGIIAAETALQDRGNPAVAAVAAAGVLAVLVLPFAAIVLVRHVERLRREQDERVGPVLARWGAQHLADEGAREPTP